MTPPPRPRLSGRQRCTRLVEIALDAVLRLEDRLACLEVDFEHARPLERELAGHEQDRRAISLNAYEVRPHVAEGVAVLFRHRRQRQIDGNELGRSGSTLRERPDTTMPCTCVLTSTPQAV